MVSTADAFATWMADMNKGLLRDNMILYWSLYSSRDSRINHNGGLSSTTGSLSSII
jgi:hypothetical protein